MSRLPFLRLDPAEYRWTDKIIYAHWTVYQYSFKIRSELPTRGVTTVRVRRDLYDVDDVGEVSNYIRLGLMEKLKRGETFDQPLLTWWTLLELTQVDRDATLLENR